MAKIDRASHAYALHRLHGYVLPRKAVSGLVGRLGTISLQRRATIPGLNDDRADSIVGGTVVVDRLMKALEAKELHVSGRGLREGLVLSRAFDDQLPPAEQVRRVSVFALAGRFSGWAPNSAARKAQIASSLLAAASPDAPTEIVEALAHAAHLLDVGRNIDYYNRHEHTADIVAMSDLEGFSHRDIALLSALIRQVGRESMALRAYRPLLGDEDRPWLTKAGTALALADEIEARLSPSAGEVAWKVEGREIRLATPITAAWRPRALGSRFRRAFGARLALPEDDLS
jgi:exopolyphosphatase/guanosine-5'-triphosphate,3'-diphosphate pyrophosphatase